MFVQVPNWTQTCRGLPQGIPNVANLCLWRRRCAVVVQVDQPPNGTMSVHPQKVSISRSPGLIVASTPIPEVFLLPPEESPPAKCWSGLQAQNRGKRMHLPFWLGGKGNRPIFDLTVHIPFGEFEEFTEKIQETVSVSRSSCFFRGWNHFVCLY